MRPVECEIRPCKVMQRFLFKAFCIAILLLCALWVSAMAAMWTVFATTWPLEIRDAAKLACSNLLLCNLYQDTVRATKEEVRMLDVEALLDDEETAHELELTLVDWRNNWNPLLYWRNEDRYGRSPSQRW